MADSGWGQLLLAALGGGSTVKVLDIIYQEWRKRRDVSDAATQFVDKHLNPLLKAADELAGKLRSLAENDFQVIHHVLLKDNKLSNDDYSNLLYLFCYLWAQLEQVRVEGISAEMSKDDRGLKLGNFLDCLESRRVRLVPRVLQRAIGEACRTDKGIMNFIQFVTAYETDETFRRWITPIANLLLRTEHTTDRQMILQYGVVIHAMIDLLDSKHIVTRDRPALPKKLTAKSWAALNYRVFGVYLKFVKDRQKYIGPPKKAARKANG